MSDYESPEFYSEKQVISRKVRPCCECGSAIVPGERYQYVAGKWDKTFNAFHTCETCADLRAEMATYNDEGSFSLGNVVYELLEYPDDVVKDLSLRFPSIRNKISEETLRRIDT
jgi:hypothetical protein